MNKPFCIDTSDQSLFEEDAFMSQVTEDLTPEELERLVVEDIRSIYEMKDAV